MAGTPIETDKNKLPTKAEAIAAALKAHGDQQIEEDEEGDGVNAPEKDKKVVKKEETVVEDEDDDAEETLEEDENEEEEELDPEAEASWKILQRMMLNPQTRKDAILALAANAGINLTDSVDTEAGKKKTTRTLQDVLREKMGDDAALIPPSLFDVIEELIDAKVSTVSQRQVEAAERSNVAEAQKIQSRLQKKYNDYAELLPDILACTQRYPLTDGQTIAKHMDDMYWMAKAQKERKSSPNNKERERRIDANQKKVLPKGSTNRGDGGGGEEDKPFVAKTPKEAAQYAIALFNKAAKKSKAKA